MKKSWEQIHQELSEPFSHEDVEWKIQTVSKDKSRGLAVAYVTARAIQNRLDAVVGAQNWKPVFRQWHTVTDRDGNPIPSQLCTIQIFDDERHEWMEKTDGAENTDYEPVKGGLSDAMKRAASQWGMGVPPSILLFSACFARPASQAWSTTFWIQRPFLMSSMPKKVFRISVA